MDLKEMRREGVSWEGVPERRESCWSPKTYICSSEIRGSDFRDG